MELELTDSTGAASGSSVQLADSAFQAPFNESLVHQVVTAYMAGGRRGTKAQKGRSDVRGGGSKPWRQKGTGRARAGTIRSPIWRGGGVTFAARPRDYSQKVNRKMYRAALRSMLSELIRQGRMIAVDAFAVETPKTRDLLGKLRALGMEDVLIVGTTVDENLALAARNLPRVAVVEVSKVNPVVLIAHEHVLMTRAALQHLEERLT